MLQFGFNVSAPLSPVRRARSGFVNTRETLFLRDVYSGQPLVGVPTKFSETGWRNLFSYQSLSWLLVYEKILSLLQLYVPYSCGQQGAFKIFMDTFDLAVLK